MKKQSSLNDREERLLRLISRADVSLRIAATNAVLAARQAPGTLAALERLIEQGLIEQAIQVASRAAVVRIYDGYAAVYTSAGQAGSKFIENSLEVVIGFDQANFRAVRHLQEERLRFVREFTDEQRRATQSALSDGIERGLNPRAQARNFRSSIGLTSKQQSAVANYRRLLNRASDGDTEALTRQLRDRRFDPTVRRAIRSGEPLTNKQVERMVGRYRERYVKYRSEVIARTEALRAVHSANDEAYRQAIDEDYIQVEELRRTWTIARDDRVRDTPCCRIRSGARDQRDFPGWRFSTPVSWRLIRTPLGRRLCADALSRLVSWLCNESPGGRKSPARH